MTLVTGAVIALYLALNLVFLYATPVGELGALRGGVRFVAAYPITPATELLEWMAPALAKIERFYAEKNGKAITGCTPAALARLRRRHVFDQQRNAAFLPAIDRHVDRVQAGLVELNVLHREDEVP